MGNRNKNLLILISLIPHKVLYAESLRRDSQDSNNPRMRRRTQEIEGLDDKYAFQRDDEYKEIQDALRANVKSITFTYELPDYPIPEEEKNVLSLSPIPGGNTVIEIINPDANQLDANETQSPTEETPIEEIPEESLVHNNQGGSTTFVIIEEEAGGSDLAPWDGNALQALEAENDAQGNTTLSFLEEEKPSNTAQVTDGKTAIDVIEATSDSEPPPFPAVSDLVFGPIRYVGNDHDGWFYDRYPLGVCRGDCDTDLDCQPGLYCHSRLGGQPVPHCTGGENYDNSADFCTWDSIGIFPPPEPPPKKPIGSFRFKLYWEEGYRWQNETVERHWCMFFDYDGYPGRGECWYGLETRECDPNQLYIGQCLEEDPRQWFTFVDVGTIYSHDPAHHEVLIRTVGTPERCLMRRLSEIYLTQDCDPTDSTQRFFAVGGSFTPGLVTKSRFEISQYQGYTHENCITNAHHPKSGEVIQFHVCEAARATDDQTSFWTLLY